MPTSWSEGAMETLAAARRRGAARVNERGQGFNPSPAKPGARKSRWFHTDPNKFGLKQHVLLYNK